MDSKCQLGQFHALSSQMLHGMPHVSIFFPVNYYVRCICFMNHFIVNETKTPKNLCLIFVLMKIALYRGNDTYLHLMLYSNCIVDFPRSLYTVRYKLSITLTYCDITFCLMSSQNNFCYEVIVTSKPSPE